MRYIIFLLLILTFNLSGQTNTDLSFILKSEAMLHKQFELLRSDITDAEKDTLNQDIIELFSSVLIQPESFFYPGMKLIYGKINQMI